MSPNVLHVRVDRGRSFRRAALGALAVVLALPAASFTQPALTDDASLTCGRGSDDDGDES